MSEIKCIYWYARDGFSEFNFGGWSIIMEGVDSDFPIEVATDFDLNITITSWYEPPRETKSQRPEITLQRRDVTVSIWKYIQAQDFKVGGEIQRIYWYYKEKLLEIHFGMWSIIMGGVDPDFARALAKDSESPISLVSSYVPPYGVTSKKTEITQQEHGVSVYLWKYPNHPDNLRPDPSTFTTMDAVVKDIISRLGEVDKANVRSKSKEQLIEFHWGWGQGIRNYYKLWHNKALVKATGEEDAKDASMAIIEAVWKALQEIGDNE